MFKPNRKPVCQQTLESFAILLVKVLTVHDAVALRGNVGSTSGIFFQDMRDDTQPDILSFDDPTAAL